jgi:hypothetical protein
MAYAYGETAWVAEDGSWSAGGKLVTFDVTGLTAEQWDILSTLTDSDRVPFTLACLDGKDIQSYVDEYYF